MTILDGKEVLPYFAHDNNQWRTGPPAHRPMAGGPLENLPKGPLFDENGAPLEIASHMQRKLMKHSCKERKLDRV